MLHFYCDKDMLNTPSALALPDLALLFVLFLPVLVDLMVLDLVVLDFFVFLLDFLPLPDLARVVGELVGEAVGEAVGATVGEAVGATVGEMVGATVAEMVGTPVGEYVGKLVGAKVGTEVGDKVGGDVIGDVLGVLLMVGLADFVTGSSPGTTSVSILPTVNSPANSLPSGVSKTCFTNSIVNTSATSSFSASSITVAF